MIIILVTKPDTRGRGRYQNPRGLSQDPRGRGRGYKIRASRGIEAKKNIARSFIATELFPGPIFRTRPDSPGSGPDPTRLHEPII